MKMLNKHNIIIGREKLNKNYQFLPAGRFIEVYI
jgi:hypothetical protein